MRKTPPKRVFCQAVGKSARVIATPLTSAQRHRRPLIEILEPVNRASVFPARRRIASKDDRSRLAVELDGAVARARSLELANGEVARRLNYASAGIKAVLAEAAARDR